ncbi:methyltransferase [Streptomyces kunmingensis]|uniref:Methyltransferase n=1 Tax=Streptomyces kunmingensis TaxID=68225 RepID=A0ABU6CQU1_9ACTN|nr:methyltransferase [Streptomyces kunmingensis]MEB3967119.1 methyltransferase [Streptomyces kunmingensis]
MITALSDDTSRLRATVDFVSQQDSETLLPLLLPGLDGPELRALVERCRFAHAALLLFPPHPRALDAALTECGLLPGAAPQPSVVVRDRLAQRHHRAAADLDVGILRPAVHGRDGRPRMVEVFTLTVPPGSGLEAIAERERAHHDEAHVAFEVAAPDPLVLRGLRASFARYGAAPDGGGYNPHENGTVFYFAAPATSKADYRRIELYAPGDHRDQLAAHLAEFRAGQPAETMLRLLTGAWTTQALTTFAHLRVPDAMDTDRAVDIGTLASAVDADADSLSVLLRHLAGFGVVTEEAPGSFRLTPAGALLRAGDPGSMRALALMYGGPFYQSFAALTHTVRTGQVAFEHVFGTNHFDHFARDPRLAELFDRSMAASRRMFEPLPAHPVLAAAARKPRGATVVDIAGGNGELLTHILATHPGLDSVLLERPHVIEAARPRLDARRCTFLAGDFADVPPGADVYLLSRILHDWDDARCLDILRHIAGAMPADADLLIVERLLPTDGSPSLAAAWDLHMRCNVGGRERTAQHYARLLTDAGLTLVGHTPLPLEGRVLHARRTSPAVTP